MKISKTTISILIKLLLISVVVFFLAANNWFSDKEYINSIVELNDGWDIIVNGETRKDQKLSDIDVGVQKPGDQVILFKTLPYDEIMAPAIYYRSALMQMSSTVDGGLAISYGREEAEKGRLIPKNGNYIPLPDDFAGKALRINLSNSEDNVMSGISNVYLGNRGDLSVYLVYRHRITLVIGVFLIFFGLVLLVLSVFLQFSQSDSVSIIFCAVISMILGFYGLSFYDLTAIFTSNKELVTVLEYAALYSLPAGILGLLSTTQKGKLRIISMVLFIADSIFVAASVILNYLNVLHINFMMRWFYVMCAVEGIYVIASAVITMTGRRRKKAHDPAAWLGEDCLLLGMGIFTICGIVDIVRYELVKRSIENGMAVDIRFVTVGALIFVASMMINYFFHTIGHYNASHIRKRLMSLAYNDPLTGLSNRARCDEEFKSLEAVDTNFYMISIDLDGLKEVNDTKGHQAGDIMISGFAEEIEEEFGKTAKLISRMGGDEFLVIIGDTQWNTVDRKLKDFEENLKESYTFSYGFASRAEVNGLSPREIFLMADSRMYRMKEEHHEAADRK